MNLAACVTWRLHSLFLLTTSQVPHSYRYATFIDTVKHPLSAANGRTFNGRSNTGQASRARTTMRYIPPFEPSFCCRRAVPRIPCEIGAQQGLARYRTSPSSEKYRDSVGLAESATRDWDSVSAEAGSVRHVAVRASANLALSHGAADLVMGGAVVGLVLGLTMDGVSVGVIEAFFLHFPFNLPSPERHKSRVNLISLGMA
jgi:hypothetical protein